MEYLEDGRLELYNLREDIGETKNRSRTLPEKAEELRASLPKEDHSHDQTARAIAIFSAVGGILVGLTLKAVA